MNGHYLWLCLWFCMLVRFFPPSQHIFRFDSGRLPDFRCHSRLERAGKVNISGSWRHVSISGMFSVLQERQMKTEPLGALQMWTVPNTFDYICEAAVCCGRVTCRKDNELGNTPSKHQMIFDLECKQRAPSSCSDFLCLLHTYLSSKTDKCIATFRCSLP